MPIPPAWLRAVGRQFRVGEGFEEAPAQNHRFPGIKDPLRGQVPHRLRADPLAADDLNSRIDAGSGAVAEAVAHHLCEMAHELVVVFEPVAFDPDDGPVVGHAEQEIPTLGIEECGDGLERGVGHPLVVLAVLHQVPAQRDLNSRVFDSPLWISSSALRWLWRYWSKRKIP